MTAETHIFFRALIVGLIISNIKEMKKDRDYLRICAFTVGEFATASLHLRGIEKYSGSNHSILRLIESKFQF